MKRSWNRLWFLVVLLPGLLFLVVKCTGRRTETGKRTEPVHLIWYQIGTVQQDGKIVEEQVNDYISEKIGVTVEIIPVNWSDYNTKMRSIISTGAHWDLAFSSSWANDYLEIAQKGALLPLDDLLGEYGTGLLSGIDERFWEAATIDGKIYGVPNQKELGSMPMWVFTKEYVEKYDIPFEELHTLEDLEPWLALIAERNRMWSRSILPVNSALRPIWIRLRILSG